MIIHLPKRYVLISGKNKYDEHYIEISKKNPLSIKKDLFLVQRPTLSITWGSWNVKPQFKIAGIKSFEFGIGKLWVEFFG